MNNLEEAAKARKEAQRRDVERSMQMKTVETEDKEGEEFPEGGSTNETPEEAEKRESRDCIGFGLLCWGIGVACFSGDNFCHLGSIPFFLIGLIVFGGHPRAPRLVKIIGGLSGIVVFGSIAVIVIAVVVALLFSGFSAMWGDISHMIGM